MTTVPTEAARLFAVSRSAPTSADNSFGKEATNTLKSRATSAIDFSNLA